MERFSRFSKVALLASLALSLATAAGAATIVVNTTTDQSLGSCSSSCSVRDAVATAAPGDTVSIPAGTYVLTLGAIAIDKNLTLAGAGARSTILDGNAASRVLEVGVNNQNIGVTISDLTVRNGYSPYIGGGGIENEANLNVQRCTITANLTEQDGGGIYNGSAASLLLVDSLVAGNESKFPGGLGGGIYNSFLMVMANSTVSGNTAADSGGGVATLGNGFTGGIADSTISGNSAPSGGGILTFGPFGPLVAFSTIIGGNTGGDCQFLTAPLVSDHSLDSDGSCGMTGAGDLSGVNPLLGPLANNGGPTDTRALLTGSPAIDAGGTNCPPTDQRGVTRPQGPACDIGAFEKEVTPPPSCASATASPNRLWPPNHKFVPITISGIVNPAPGAVTISVTSIFQDEPTSGAPDATGVGTGSPSVRAERDGGGDGRVYHINFTATGASGSCTGSVTVGVPHDQGHNGGPVDQGPLYNSTLP